MVLGCSGGIMKKIFHVSVVVAAIGMWGLLASGQIVLELPVANLTEKWAADASGWTSADPLCGWTNQSLVFKCTVRSGTDPAIYTSNLSGGTNASNGYFTGNFSKIEAVAFDAIPGAFTLNPNFYFKSRSGTVWKTKFAAALDGKPDGVPVAVTIPFSYSTNWWSGWPSDQQAHFLQDSSDIVELGFEFIRYPNDETAQQLSVDNLKLIGPWGTMTNGVAIAWVLESGLPVTNLSTISSEDSDHDGFSNAAEFLAGTDPVDSNSFFTVAIERNETGEMVLKWKGNRYVSYDLMESVDLMSPSSFVAVATNITATSSQVQANVQPSVGTGGKFYKVRINSK